MRECDGEESAALNGSREAAMAESASVSTGGDVVCEKSGADQGDARTTRSNRAHSVWSSPPLTELAEAQGAAPVEDQEGLAALWPSDDDPDEVLAHVLAERAVRRRQGDGGDDHPCLVPVKS